MFHKKNFNLEKIFFFHFSYYLIYIQFISAPLQTQFMLFFTLTEYNTGLVIKNMHLCFKYNCLCLSCLILLKQPFEPVFFFHIFISGLSLFCRLYGSHLKPLGEEYLSASHRSVSRKLAETYLPFFLLIGK